VQSESAMLLHQRGQKVYLTGTNTGDRENRKLIKCAVCQFQFYGTYNAKIADKYA
jgi:hypothetical protein